MTRLAAIPLFGAALTLAAFGVIRGVMPAGPGAGTRIVLAIAPPVDEDARAMAEHVVRARVEDQAGATRVVPAGDQLVVELGDTDPASVGDIEALLSRTAKLELHLVIADEAWPAADHVARDPRAHDAGIRVASGALVADDREAELAVADADAIGCRGRTEDGKRRCRVRGDRVLATYLASVPALAVPPGRTLAFGRSGDHTWTAYLLDDSALVRGPEIRHVELGDHGVIVDLTADAARRVAGQSTTRAGAPLAVVLDGVVHGVVPLPVARPEPALHLHTSGATEDGALRAASQLVDVIEAGAAHALTVTRTTRFTRATGFLPRAWPFLASALACVLVGLGLVLRRRRG